MNDLISRISLKQSIVTSMILADGKTLEQIIDEEPTIDAVKHGRWIDESFKSWELVFHPYKCDQCGCHSESNFNFCPDCGAKMDGELSE